MVHQCTKQKKMFWRCGIIFIFILFLIFLHNNNIVSNEEQTLIGKKQIKIHDTTRFFDDQLFYQGVSAKRIDDSNFDKKIYGAITPHHLLPSFIIAEIFERIAQQGTQTIILLSPNHYDIGNAPVLASELSWNTPYGEIKSQNDIIYELTRKNYIETNEAVLDNEHGIAGLLPFITYYDNSIRIVPLILRQDLTKKQIQDLSKSIADVVDEKTVVVASVDFSHYLNSAQAERNDEQTHKAIEKKDYNKLLQMNNDYLDSPEAIVILSQIMEQLGVNSSETLYHTNSGRLLDNPFAQTTSYFGMIFTN